MNPTSKKPTTRLNDLVQAAHEAGATISIALEANDSFYGRMEPGVREWVRMLRNSGINTICSCHHTGMIQCNTDDPTRDLKVIYDTLNGRVGHYNVYVDCQVHAGHPRLFMEIRSDAFKAKAEMLKGEQVKLTIRERLNRLTKK